MGHRNTPQYYNEHDRQMELLQIGAFARLAVEKTDEGWDPYLLTFMFNHLHQSPKRRTETMKAEVEKVYVKLLHRVVRRSVAPSQVGNRPIWFACSDFPVQKHEKQTLRDVSINDGQHFHALGLFPNESRLRTTVNWWLYENQRIFAPPGGLLRNVRADIVDPETTANVMSYVLKSISKGQNSTDDILMLPRSRDELISKPTALNPSLGKRLRR